MTIQTSHSQQKENFSIFQSKQVEQNHDFCVITRFLDQNLSVLDKWFPQINYCLYFTKSLSMMRVVLIARVIDCFLLEHKKKQIKDK